MLMQLEVWKQYITNEKTGKAQLVDFCFCKVIASDGLKLMEIDGNLVVFCLVIVRVLVNCLKGGGRRKCITMINYD